MQTFPFLFIIIIIIIILFCFTLKRYVFKDWKEVC